MIDVDAVVVGAGFAGLYALQRLRGLGLRVVCFEVGSGVGGTWFWNRYPGARCDVESVDYCYSFSAALQEEWEWTERYPAQPELLRYLEHVADRFDLRRDIRLETRVEAATFDEEALHWQVHTDRCGTVRATYLVMASGCLSVAAQPDVPGVESFRGRILHTARWDAKTASFGGERVGVVGTGSSGIQLIPVIAEHAAELTVFQRTPAYSLPAWNRPLDPDVQREIKTDYAGRRKRAMQGFLGVPFEMDEINRKSALEVTSHERQQEYERRWQQGGVALCYSFADLFVNREANETAAEFVRSKIREKVHDEMTAAALTPTSYPFGTKRPCVDSGYYETFNRDNVRLVDLDGSSIEEVTTGGIRAGGREYALDSIIFATGFDAMTGALLNIDIRGRLGVELREKWAGGPRTYLGIATAGFPNLFLITGPQSPSVLSNMVYSIEQHVDWISDLIEHMRSGRLATMEPVALAEDEWTDHVNELADRTLYPEARSWFSGANIPGKPRSFMVYLGGVAPYRILCDQVATAGYPGIRFSPSRT